MDESELVSLLRQTIAKVCGVDAASIAGDTKLDDVGADSLAVAEIIVEVEIAVDRELPIHLLRELDRVATVDDVARELAAALDAL